MPIIMFSISAPLPAVELTSFLEQNVQKRIESVNGVGEVILFGAAAADPGQDRSRPPQRLRTRDLGRRAALRAQNLELPGGRLEQGVRELSVRTVGRLTRPEEFADVVVATRNNIPIRIGHRHGRRHRCRSDCRSRRSTARRHFGGRPQAERRQHRGAPMPSAHAWTKSADAAADLRSPPDPRRLGVHPRLARRHRGAPDLGGILAAVIVLIFLRNFRSTLIAAVAIPASIIGAFGVMSALNFTINQMTMLALTLMVGIVIDAIVVLENIYRFVEEKRMTPRRAAVEATKEIGLAVMATTMSLLAVFLPVGFLGGIIGRFMSSFGLTSAAAIAISLIVSFTLTPMLASRWIKHDHDERASDHRGAASTATSIAPTRADAGILDGSPLGDRRRARWSSPRWSRCSGRRASFTPRRTSRDSRSRSGPVGSSLAATTSLMERIARDMREQLPGVSDTLSFPGGGGGFGRPTRAACSSAQADRRARARSGA